MQTQSSTRFNFLSRILSFSLVAACAVAWANPIHAQISEQEVNDLQKTIQMLQTRLDQVKKQDEKKQDNNNGRVINLGSQTLPPTVKQIQTPQLQLQFYDLSDVFGWAPQYPVQSVVELDKDGIGIHGRGGSNGGFGGGGFGGGGFGGGGAGGVFSLPPSISKPKSDKSNLTINSITEVIKSTVDSAHWEETDASIAQVGRGLLINAAPSTHQKIQKLFDLFRSQWGSLRTVAIEGYWIELTAKELSELVNADASKKVQADKGVGVIESEQWKTFFAKAEENGAVKYATAITAHNNQTAHSLSGNQPRFLVNVEPEFSEVGEKVPTKIAHRYYYSHIQTGLTFQTTPVATRGGNYVLLDLHCRIVEMLPSTKKDEKPKSEPKQKPATPTFWNSKGQESDPVEIAKIIEQPNYSLQRLSTTVRCPTGEVVLAGGMTQPADIQKGGKEQRKHLYLFVKSTVYNVKPDQSDRMTTAKK